MSLPEFDHFEPVTLAEACSLLKRYEASARVIAGGTDLLNLMRNGLAEPAYLVDLKGIPELKEMGLDESKGLVIGAGVTLSGLIGSPLIRERAPLLAEAVMAVAAPPLQNMGTLGGNVCLNTRCFFYDQSKSWRSARPPCFKTGGSVCHVVKSSDRCHSVFQADTAAGLAGLNARVRLVEEGGERVLPLSLFYTGRGESPNVLKPTEILREIIIPQGGDARGCYEKLSARASIDFPQVGVAVVLRFNSNRTIREAKVIVSAVASAPVEVEGIRELLIGKEADEEVIEEAARLAREVSRPVHNTGLSPAYRRKMVGVLVRRALRRVLSNGRRRNTDEEESD